MTKLDQAIYADRHKVYKKSISHYGIYRKLTTTIEECAELIQAIAKAQRYGKNVAGGIEMSHEHRAAIIDEVADVTIMMEQMQMLFPPEKIRERIAFKVNRLKKRIDAEGRTKNT